MRDNVWMGMGYSRPEVASEQLVEETRMRMQAPLMNGGPEKRVSPETEAMFDQWALHQQRSVEGDWHGWLVHAQHYMDVVSCVRAAQRCL